MQDEKNIKLNIEMNVNEANLVLKALGEIPYSQSAKLINQITRQAQAQVNEELNAGKNTDEK